MKNPLGSLATAALIAGIALGLNACNSQSPFGTGGEESAAIAANNGSVMHTASGAVNRLRMDPQASALLKASAADSLFRTTQFMPAIKRGNIRLGNTYYGHSKVTFFRKSLQEDATIQFEWLASSTFEGMLNNMEFGPHGATFPVPVRVQLSYKKADLTGVDETALQVYYFNEETGLWELIGGEVDTENKLIIVYLKHFSRYAIGEN